MPGGAGFSRLPDGRPAFVDGAVPGDVVVVQAFVDKKTYVDASHFELESPSPLRVTPACPIAEACGGCDWMALPYSAQLEHKVALVVEALERTARVKLPQAPSITAATTALGYRLRVRLHVDASGRVGFYGRRTRELVPVAACPIAAPELAPVIAALHGLPAEQKLALGSCFAAVDLRAVPGGGGVELELVQRADADLARIDVEALLGALEPHARIGTSEAPRGGLRRYDLPSGGFLRVPTIGFTQVNWQVNAELVLAVLAGAAERQAKRFLDLYAGVGNFTVPLARAGLKGTAVELEHSAVAALREALREQALGGVEVVAGDVPTALGRPKKLRGLDVVVLDPPRAGAKEAIAPLIALGAKSIAYVACDPVTLARDLRRLLDAGYALDSVRCFDMFPQTHHVETLAWLTRAR